MISEERIKRKMAEVLMTAYQQGVVMPPDELTEILKSYTEMTDLESPSFEPPTFMAKSKLELAAFNNAVAQMVDDTDLLYDTDVKVTTELLRQISVGEATFNSHIWSLKYTQARLEDLLLTANAGFGALFSVYDDFADLSKVDGSNTTSKVDLGLKTVTLTDNKSASRRIHLSPGIRIRTNIIEPADGDRVLQAPSTAGAKNILDDTLSAWVYDLRTLPPTGGISGKDEPATVEVEMELSEDDAEVKFSRADVAFMIPGSVQVTMLYTRDFRNWLAFPGYEEAIETENAPITLRFPEIRAKAIRIRMRKPRADEVTPEVNLYRFGLKNVALYTMGYSSESQLQSVMLSPDVDGIVALDRASIWVDDEVPENTTITYEIGTPGYAGVSWAEVSPLNREQPTNKPKVLKLGSIITSPWDDNLFLIDGTPSTGVEGGLPYYNILPSNTITGVVPGTGKLRKLNAWLRIPRPNIQRQKVHVKGNQWRIGGGGGNMVQFPYVKVDDEPANIITGVVQEWSADWAGEQVPPVCTGFDTDSKLIVDHQIHYDPAGADPMTSQGPAGSAEGSYRRDGTETDLPGAEYTYQRRTSRRASEAFSVEKAVHIVADTDDFDSVASGVGAYIRVAIRPGQFIRGVHAARRVVYIGLPEIFDDVIVEEVYLDYLSYKNRPIQGFFRVKPYRMLTDMTDGFSDGAGTVLPFTIKNIAPMAPPNKSPRGLLSFFIAEDPDGLLEDEDAVMYRVTRVDITPLIKAVDGNIITVDKRYPRLVGHSKVLVSYRRLLDQQEELVTNSMKVVLGDSMRAPDAASELIQGVHYNTDKRSVTFNVGTDQMGIQVGPGSKLTADFDYLKAAPQVSVYSTYFILERDLKVLRIADPGLDTARGDSLRLFIKGVEHNVTGAAEIVNLPAGPIKVIVVSTPLIRTDGSTDTDCALYRTLTAVDWDGNPVFVPGSKYWKKQVTVLQPMQEVSYLDLTRNIPRRERGFFAYYNGGVWLNHDPYYEQNALKRYVSVTGVPTGVIDLSQNPQYEMMYKHYISDSSRIITGVYLRATHRRNAENTGGDITPQLRKYSIRFA